MKLQWAMGVALASVLSACSTHEAVLLKVDPVTLRPLAHAKVSVGAAKVAGSGAQAGTQVIVPFVDQDPLIFERSTDERSPRTVTWRLPAVLAVQHGLRFPEANAIGGQRAAAGAYLVQVKDLNQFTDLGASPAGEKKPLPVIASGQTAVLTNCKTAADGLSVTCAVIAQQALIFSYEIRVQQGDKVYVLDPTGMIN